jgi:hypothetical protein
MILTVAGLLIMSLVLAYPLLLTSVAQSHVGAVHHLRMRKHHVAPWALAQTPRTDPSGSSQGTVEQSRPETGSPGQTGQTGTSTRGRSTTDAQRAMHATVAEVNHQRNTIKLRMQGGETVELNGPRAIVGGPQ